MRSDERRGDLPSPDAAFLGLGIIWMQGFQYFECGFRGWPILGRKIDGVMETTLDHINGKCVDHQRYYLYISTRFPFSISCSLPIHLWDALAKPAV